MTRPARPDVLALPTSTTLRMVLVAVALVVSALFVGTALYNAVHGQAWDEAVLACLGPGGVLPSTAAQLACEGAVERGRAEAAMLAAAAATVLAAVLIALAPVVVRRRRRLVPADARYARAVRAVTEIASAAGVRAPGVLIGPGRVSEPFCIGRPGDYRIVLPRKLALLGNPALFDALVGHEVAHLVHRDVALSWLARSLWYVLGPLLALPALVFVARGEPALAVDILWRSAVLIGIVLLVVRGLMRAREHDADLRAARVPGVGHVLDVELSRHPGARSGWRAAIAWHPEVSRRRAVLTDPAAVTALSLVDGVALGFLAALALPIVDAIASAWFLGVLVAGLPALVGALVLGPLFGATIGVGLWRHALAARGDGRRMSTAAVALGVLIGGLLGQLASLAGVGLGAPHVLLLLPIALAGMTVLIGGLGDLWVSGVGRTRRPTAVWVPAALFGAAAATAVLWAVPQAQSALDGGGWALLAAWLTTPGALVLPGVVAGLLAAATGWALRPGRDGSVPRWWADPPAQASRPDLPSWPAPGRGAVLVGLAAGLAGGLALAGYRLAAGPASGDTDTIQRFDAAVLGCGLVGVAALVILGLARGPGGAASGLLAGPVAALTAGVSFLVTVAVSGGHPLPLAAHVLGGAVTSGFLVAVPAAVAGTARTPRGPSTALVAALAVAAGAVITPTVAAARRVLVPGLSAVVPGYSEATGPTDGPGPGQPLPPVDPVVPRELYRDVVARPLINGRAASAAAFRELQNELPSNAVAASRIRAEILPLLRQMLDGAQSVRIEDPTVLEVHKHAVEGARLHVAGFTMLADALDHNDQAPRKQASALIAQGNAEWQRWATGVLTL